MSEQIEACRSCRGNKFWVSKHGLTICERCHPVADEKMIEKRIVIQPPENSQK